jgi:hypothetical protein
MQPADSQCLALLPRMTRLLLYGKPEAEYNYYSLSVPR